MEFEYICLIHSRNLPSIPKFASLKSSASQLTVSKAFLVGDHDVVKNTVAVVPVTSLVSKNISQHKNIEDSEVPLAAEIYELGPLFIQDIVFAVSGALGERIVVSK